MSILTGIIVHGQIGEAMQQALEVFSVTEKLPVVYVTTVVAIGSWDYNLVLTTDEAVPACSGKTVICWPEFTAADIARVLQCSQWRRQLLQMLPTQRYITAVIMGGLGNQLFQIAITLAIAREQNYMPVFCCAEQCAAGQGNSNWVNYWHTFFARLPQCAPAEMQKLQDVQQVHENCHHIMMSIPQFTRNIRLNGFFQTMLYFSRQQQHIREILRLAASDQLHVDSVIAAIRHEHIGRKLVSLHVRRTDYCKLGWNLSLPYYRKALTHFDEETCVFLIFSDDLAWCRENFAMLPHTVYVEDLIYRELFIMAACDAHIMANSSYSWWGVFFGDPEQQKEVYAPRHFLPCDHNAHFQERYWHAIENTFGGD